uniref:Uncharacterized protein n=1 Tax=Heterosigma akashiwo TaxID=2829 RepID=A0A7S3Y2I0_HETAK
MRSSSQLQPASSFLLRRTKGGEVEEEDFHHHHLPLLTIHHHHHRRRRIIIIVAAAVVRVGFTIIVVVAICVSTKGEKATHSKGEWQYREEPLGSGGTQSAVAAPMEFGGKPQ